VARSKSAQLDALDALIAQIEASPIVSYTIGGRQVSKQDHLAEMYAERRTLEREASEVARGGRRVQRVVPL
jgi:hypothetical protein